MKKRFLKWRYRRLHLKIKNYKGYNCGHSMQMQIDMRYYHLIVTFNYIADKLAKIDPECPKFRYSLI